MKDGEKAKAGAAAPEECVTAAVQPEDASYVYGLAEHEEREPWLVSGVLAGIGSDSLRNPGAAAKIDFTCAECLWICINREPESYSESVLVMLDGYDGFGWEVETDAAQIGRDLGDWLGTLIHLGIQIHRAGRGLEFAIPVSDHFKLLLDRCEVDARRANGKEATCS